HPEIYISQVRAMMKASLGLNNLQILLPMISNMNEVEYSIHLLDRAHQELLEEGLDVVRPKLGVMIEIPAAVFQVKAFARKADFVSVGSNDLTQYILAVDRNNPRVSSLFSNLHPSVLRVLQQIVDDVHEVGKTVSICGEMAGNPGAAVLLMAMGYDILSMNATNLLKVKSVIRNFTMQQARELLARVLEEESTEGVKAMLDFELYNAGVDRLLRSSRTS
ncbi:MAG: putative PEP-binding protein, partial [Pseudohongiellaceae bacterium]